MSRKKKEQNFQNNFGMNMMMPNNNPYEQYPFGGYPYGNGYGDNNYWNPSYPYNNMPDPSFNPMMPDMGQNLFDAEPPVEERKPEKKHKKYEKAKSKKRGFPIFLALLFSLATLAVSLISVVSGLFNLSLDILPMMNVTSLGGTRIGGVGVYQFGQSLFGVENFYSKIFTGLYPMIVSILSIVIPVCALIVFIVACVTLGKKNYKFKPVGKGSMIFFSLISLLSVVGMVALSLLMSAEGYYLLGVQPIFDFKSIVCCADLGLAVIAGLDILTMIFASLGYKKFSYCGEAIPEKKGKKKKKNKKRK